MKLHTLRFGEIEIDDQTVLSFANGIPGFEAIKSYTLITVDNSPFMHLQAVENGNLAFIVVSPFDFFPSYEFDLQERVTKELDITRDEQIKVLNMISIRHELSSATVNLTAPLIINTRNHKGTQYIIPDGKYSIQQPLFGKLSIAGEGR